MLNKKKPDYNTNIWIFRENNSQLLDSHAQIICKIKNSKQHITCRPTNVNHK